MKYSYAELAGMIDHSLLHPTLTDKEVEEGCLQAIQYGELDQHLSGDEKIAMLRSQVEDIDPGLLPRLPLLGPVLNLSIPENELTGSLDGKLRKESLEAMLVDIVRKQSRSTPTLIVLENCHWLDPLSYDLLKAIAKSISDRPVCLVMAYRPPDLPRSAMPRLEGLSHFFEIDLNEFSNEEAAELIKLKLEQFFGSHRHVSEAFTESITRPSQGNPFYIEELINYLQDSGRDPKDIDAVEQLDLPSSLHSLILTRIDQRTESQKITLKLASIIGRIFVASWLWGAFPPLKQPNRCLPTWMY